MSRIVSRDSSPVRPIVKPPAPPRPPKPLAAVARSVTVIEPPTPDSDGWMALRIRVGTEEAVYLLRPIACDIGGAAFEVEKLDVQLQIVEAYHVRIGAPAVCSCDCKGFTYHTHCKHVEGLLALEKTGRLPAKQKHAACPLCEAPVDGGQLCDKCHGEEGAFEAYHQLQEMEAGGMETFADEPPELPEEAYFDPADL